MDKEVRNVVRLCVGLFVGERVVYGNRLSCEMMWLVESQQIHVAFILSMTHLQTLESVIRKSTL